MASSGRINVGLSVGANGMTPHRRSCVNCRAEAGVWSTVTVASAAASMPGNPIGIWDMSPGFRAARNIRRVAKAFKKGSWWIPGSWMCDGVQPLVVPLSSLKPFFFKGLHSGGALLGPWWSRRPRNPIRACARRHGFQCLHRDGGVRGQGSSRASRGLAPGQESDRVAPGSLAEAPEATTTTSLHPSRGDERFSSAMTPNKVRADRPSFCAVSNMRLFAGKLFSVGVVGTPYQSCSASATMMPSGPRM